jgi:hypothetical protein
MAQRPWWVAGSAGIVRSKNFSLLRDGMILGTGRAPRQVQLNREGWAGWRTKRGEGG